MVKRKKKRIVLIIITVIAVLLILFAIGMTYYIGNEIVDSSTQLVTNEDTKGVSENFWKKYNMDYDKFKASYQFETIALKSTFDGHTIPGDLIYAGSKDNDTVIMVHGLGGNRYSNYPVAQYFLEEGYNVVTYDQRSTNENTAERTTFGYWEKYDTIDCIDFVKTNAPGRKIGLWGTSFGGATAVQAAAYEDVQESLSFLILDCPLSSMEWMLEEAMREMDTGLPLSYMVWSGDMANKRELGFSYEDADSAEAAKNITIPALIINSEADEITPYFMGRDIYEAVAGPDKELWTVPDSAHADVWIDYNEEYRNKLSELLYRCR